MLSRQSVYGRAAVKLELYYAIKAELYSLGVMVQQEAALEEYKKKLDEIKAMLLKGEQLGHSTKLQLHAFAQQAGTAAMDLISLRGLRAEKEAVLMKLIGAPLPAGLSYPPPPEIAHPLDEAAIAQALNAHPALSAAFTKVKAQKLQVAYQQASRWNDMSVGLGFGADLGVGDTALLFKVALPLPLFNKNKGAVAMAQMNQHKASLALQQHIFTLKSRARLLRTRLKKLRLLLTHHKEIILHHSKALWKMTLQGYHLGEISYLIVLTANTKYLEALRRYYSILRACHETNVALQALIDTDGILAKEIKGGTP